MSLLWLGKELIKKMEVAEAKGINLTMAAAVLVAKRNHPGWQNRTGTAEGSIRVSQFAKREGGRLFGLWGSLDVDYMLNLEFFHGSALRSAGDNEHAKLASRIAKELIGVGGGRN